MKIISVICMNDEKGHKNTKAVVAERKEYTMVKRIDENNQHNRIRNQALPEMQSVKPVQ